jgi:prephenate dehydrogenase
MAFVPSRWPSAGGLAEAAHAETMNRIRHIGIVGLGQVGGSLAAALKSSQESRYRIGALELKAKLIEEAQDRHLVDYAIDADLEELRKIDLVVLAAPVRAIISMIPAFKRRMAPGSILLDVGSTKRDVATAMDAGDEAIFCFGGHPLAGTPASGPETWDPKLFANRPFVLVRTHSSTQASEAMLRTLIRDIGAHIIFTDPDAHDRAMAAASHLPLLLANALVTLNAQRGDAAGATGLIGGAFDSATDPVRKPPEIVADILATNRDFIAEAYDELDGEVRRLLGLLHRDVDGIRRELANTRIARSRLLPDEEP